MLNHMEGISEIISMFWGKISFFLIPAGYILAFQENKSETFVHLWTGESLIFVRNFIYNN